MARGNQMTRGKKIARGNEVAREKISFFLRLRSRGNEGRAEIRRARK